MVEAKILQSTSINMSPGYAVCEIVFMEAIDCRSRVKMFTHRPTVYHCRPVMVS